MWRQLGLDLAPSAKLVAEVHRLRRSTDREERALAATLAAELRGREAVAVDAVTRTTYLGVPRTLRHALDPLPGVVLLVALALWALGWIPAWTFGPIGHLTGVFGLPVLALCVVLQYGGAWTRLRLAGVVYPRGLGATARKPFEDPDLLFRARPERVYRGMNGHLVVQVLRHYPSPTLSSGEVVEAAALAVLAERYFGEQCMAEVRYMATHHTRRVHVGPDARETLAQVLAYMRGLLGSSEPGPARADPACFGCGLRLLCPEGRDAAQSR